MWPEAPGSTDAPRQPARSGASEVSSQELRAETEVLCVQDEPLSSHPTCQPPNKPEPRREETFSSETDGEAQEMQTEVPSPGTFSRAQ